MARAAATGWSELTDFGLCWLLCRPFRPVVRGLPAAVVAAALVGLLIAALGSNERLVRLYREAMVRQQQQQQWPTAELYLRKLVRLDPSDPATRYQLALAAERRGDRDQASLLMQQLAPQKTQGYGPAHWWLARQLARQPVALSPETATVLEHHLRASLARAPRNDEARWMLIQLLLAQGRLDEAVGPLERLARREPAAWLLLAKIHLAMGREREADGALDAARRVLRALVTAHPDAVDERLLAAEAELLRGDFRQSAALLIEGQAQLQSQAGRQNSGKQVTTLRRRLVDVYLQWFDAASRRRLPGSGERLQLLQKALQLEPNNPDALARLAVLASQSGDESERAMQQLQRTIRRGGAPAVVHAILGTAAALRGEEGEAVRQLQKASTLAHQMPAVANNLAWLLAKATPPDLQQAEQLANVAVEAVPTDPEFRETRGMIRARLGKHKEAIVDLEQALRAFPRRRRIHAALADLYQQIGDEKLAESHRQLATR